MKIRLGFISNSSSSSFIIANKYISTAMTAEIKKCLLTVDPEWKMDESGSSINLKSIRYPDFDMYDFLVKLGINEDNIEFDD